MTSIILYLLLLGFVNGNTCPGKLYMKKNLAPKRQFISSHHQPATSLVHCAKMLNRMRSQFSSALLSGDEHCEFFKEAFAASELVTTLNTIYIHMG